MTSDSVDTALTRAERALARIERAAEQASRRDGGDDRLREKVRAAIAELDSLISRVEA